MNQYTKCILCGNPAIDFAKKSGEGSYFLECEICGRYFFDMLSRFQYTDLSDDDKPMISAFTRDHLERNLEPPDLGLLDRKQVADIIRRYRNKPLLEKVDNLIIFLGNHSKYFGQPLKLIGEKTYPVTFSTNRVEFENIKNQIIKEGLAEVPLAGGNISLELKGWTRYDSLLSSSLESNSCFVAMSFKPTLNDVYESGIKPAILDAGYNPIRVDRREHNEKICDLIIAEIRKSRFVVADFTRQRQGVYYEAGYALGLGRPVIFLCAKKEEKRVHFDTRQYNHIFWETPLELRDKLKSRIEATIT